MRINKAILHRILAIMPGLVFAIFMRLFQFVSTPGFLLMLIVDIISVFGGIWWLQKSSEIADKLTERFSDGRN